MKKINYRKLKLFIRANSDELFFLGIIVFFGITQL